MLVFIVYIFFVAIKWSEILTDNKVNTAGADNANGSIQDSSHQSNASGFVEDTYSVDNKSGPGEVTGKDGSQVVQVVLQKTQVMQWWVTQTILLQ